MKQVLPLFVVLLAMSLTHPSASAHSGVSTSNQEQPCTNLSLEQCFEELESARASGDVIIERQVRFALSQRYELEGESESAIDVLGPTFQGRFGQPFVNEYIVGAHIYISLGDLDNAERLLSEATRAYPTSRIAWQALLATKFRQEDNLGALSIQQRMFELNLVTNGSEILTLARGLMTLGDPADARQVLQLATERGLIEHDGAVLNEIFSSYLRDENFELAYQALTELVSIEASDRNLLRLCRFSIEQMSRQDAIADCHGSANRMNPETSELRQLWIAVHHMHLADGEFDASREALARAEEAGADRFQLRALNQTLDATELEARRGLAAADGYRVGTNDPFLSLEPTNVTWDDFKLTLALGLIRGDYDVADAFEASLLTVSSIDFGSLEPEMVRAEVVRHLQDLKIFLEEDLNSALEEHLDASLDEDFSIAVPFDIERAVRSGSFTGSSDNARIRVSDGETQQWNRQELEFNTPHLQCTLDEGSCLIFQYAADQLWGGDSDIEYQFSRGEVRILGAPIRRAWTNLQRIASN